jgi:lysophospholipase L1-like esterase
MISALIATFLLAPEPIRVACVGDSITAGYGLPKNTAATNSYPALLGKRLGGGYVVKNFGHTGCTLMNLDWLPPLMKTDEYKQSLAFKPNIVILMGGTNDGPPRNWSHVSQLPDDLKKIVDSYQDLPSNPKVYFMLPPRLLTKTEGGALEGDQCNNVNQLLPPIYRGFAKTRNIPVIDSRGAITTKDCYQIDGIHLNEKGCAKLSNQVAFTILKKKKGS